MPKIQVLDKQVAELIAAGEVVERPSAVIKELVENSVDAGATVITVEIRRGGVTYMRVTDNGCGIAPEDVSTAFLRHATSKVVSQEDLNAIGTLGFRGEALASISAVSHVELLTRGAEYATGTRYTCGGEELPTLAEAGCPQGTTIVVRDLFFNTPARMKFLKKDSTEGNAVAGILDKLALSHPEISFRLIRDGREQLRTPGDSKLASAVYAVYGKEFSSGLIPVDYQLDHVHISGFVCTPAATRPNRSMQNIFINGRFIRSRTAMAALEEAYKGSIMVGKFPACVLHMLVACGAVDVNVHPTKLEVRFVNERPIFDAVYHGVRSALNQGDRPKVMEIKRPVLSPYTPELQKPDQMKINTLNPTEGPLILRDSRAVVLREPERSDPILEILEQVPQPVPLPQNSKSQESLYTESIPRPQLVERPRPKPQPPFQSPSPQDFPPQPNSSVFPVNFHRRILGEAFGTYIIVEYSSDQLMLIDKHAAHERLIYERLKASERGSEAQKLLEPIAVNLDMDEYSALLAHEEEMLRAGFEISDFGSGTVLVRSAPMLLDGGDAAAAVMEIAGYLAGFKTEITTEHMDWLYHNVACRAAMKAGDHSSREELAALAEQLEQNPQVRYCPHGRPVYILLKKKEIEKQFGRI